MKISRRARALLSTAALWGAAWSVPGLAWIGWLEMHRDDGLPFNLLTVVVYAFLNWSLIGAIGGSVFALTLGLAERRRSSLDTLSMRRVISWGAIGGAAFPLLVLPLVPIVAGVRSTAPRNSQPCGSASPSHPVWRGLWRARRDLRRRFASFGAAR